MLVEKPPKRILKKRTSAEVPPEIAGPDHPMWEVSDDEIRDMSDPEALLGPDEEETEGEEDEDKDEADGLVSDSEAEGVASGASSD